MNKKKKKKPETKGQKTAETVKGRPFPLKTVSLAVWGAAAVLALCVCLLQIRGLEEQLRENRAKTEQMQSDLLRAVKNWEAAAGDLRAGIQSLKLGQAKARVAARDSGGMDKALNDLSSQMQDIRKSRFLDMVDQAVGDAANDGERCIRLAGYIAGHVRNTHDSTEIPSADPMKIWERRTGLCSQRSMVMLEALKALNIKAKIWNMYDYPFGHTCLQAFYDGAWHFFDPTYGGYFTDGKGHVLSWDQVVENPEKAVENMVVFRNTRDVYSNGTRVDNTKRMRQVYAVENLARAKAAGENGERVFTLDARLDLSGLAQKPFELGKTDGRSEDMNTPDVERPVQCFYMDSLGFRTEKFVHRLILENLKSTKPIAITFFFTGKGRGGAGLLAESETGTIAPETSALKDPRARKWTISYTPKDTLDNEVVIRLPSYDSRRWRMLDAIRVEQAE